LALSLDEGTVPADTPFPCPSSWKKRSLAAISVWLLAMNPLFPPAGTSQDVQHAEYEWKANFLAKSANFVDWPDDPSTAEATTFRWCVFGTYSFGTSLAELTRNITINKKRSEVKWIRKEAELGACQIIFVSRSEIKRYSRVLD